ncbi:hypothetical protein BDM02DRAFT_2328434 [Thelephora ganbajun]|uniref:Uncharacterized protein n=1 Tax=Thelephora ganbajun TaxID=370292 RepID=A0ACB6ZFK7_THEGA|nr:hypothetical protein BDM02DRAFT_2328434 [Thelephora ganbajun]
MMPWDEVLSDVIYLLYPGFVKNLDARLIETLCIEEGALRFYEERRHVEEVLGHLENIKMLILSNAAVGPYLQALVPAGGTGIDGCRCSKLASLVIYNRDGDLASYQILPTLSHVARERKVAGFPLGSVSIFCVERSAPGYPDSDLEELRRWIGTLELVLGMMRWIGMLMTISWMGLIVFEEIDTCDEVCACIRDIDRGLEYIIVPNLILPPTNFRLFNSCSPSISPLLIDEWCQIRIGNTHAFTVQTATELVRDGARCEKAHEGYGLRGPFCRGIGNIL